MLAIRPSDVKLTAAVPGNTEPLVAVIDRLRQGGVHSVSPTGVLGDPTTAGSADGERILRTWTDDLSVRVDAWLAAGNRVTRAGADTQNSRSR